MFASIAQSATLTQRVSAGMTNLEKKLGEGSPTQRANNLLRTGARKEVFDLQTYGRLFQYEFKFFGNLNKDFKELEDVIGQAQKWSDLADQSQISENKRVEYRAHLSEELGHLATLLKSWDDSQKIAVYKKKISELNLNDDQSNLLAINNIKKEIKKITEKVFDFTYGETGLHELRRSLRWPVMELELYKDLFF